MYENYNVLLRIIFCSSKNSYLFFVQHIFLRKIQHFPQRWKIIQYREKYKHCTEIYFVFFPQKNVGFFLIVAALCYQHGKIIFDSVRKLLFFIKKSFTKQVLIEYVPKQCGKLIF